MAAVAAVCAGAVLVGGASRRMGRDKATAPWGDSTMGAVVADALRRAGCAPVVGVGGRLTEHGSLGIELVADRHPGEGPLGGIITALQVLASRHVAVVACDMPFVEPEVVTQLAGACRSGPFDVAVAAAGRVEPLLAVWAPTAVDPLVSAFVAGERAVHAALGRLRVVTVAVDQSLVRNVNRPADAG